MKQLNWQSIWGRFEIERDTVRFVGEEVEQPTGPTAGVGLFISDAWFTGGTIDATVSFETADDTSCELVLYFDPSTKFMVTAGVGAPGLFNIRHCAQGGGWLVHATAGDRRNLVAGSKYRLQATLRGSHVTLSVDGVHAVAATLPYPLFQSQVGIWCWGRKDVRVSKYTVAATMPQAFIVMPFHGAYDDLDKQVMQGLRQAEARSHTRGRRNRSGYRGRRHCAEDSRRPGRYC